MASSKAASDELTKHNIQCIIIDKGRVQKKINSIFSDICRIGGGGVCPKVNFNLILNPDIKGLEGGGSRSMSEFQR